MSDKQVARDGYNEIEYADGDKVATNVYRAPSGKQVVRVHGLPHAVDTLLSIGYTFTPLLPLTDELLGALQFALNLMQSDIGMTSPDHSDDAERYAEIVRRAIEGMGD